MAYRGRNDPGLARAARYLGVGFEFAGTVVAGVLIGHYIDTHLGTEPLFTLLLTLGGMVGALYRLLWSLRRVSSSSDNDHGSGTH